MYNFPVAFLTPPQFVSEPYLRNTHNTTPQNFRVRVRACAEPEKQRRTEGNEFICIENTISVHQGSFVEFSNEAFSIPADFCEETVRRQLLLMQGQRGSQH